MSISKMENRMEAIAEVLEHELEDAFEVKKKNLFISLCLIRKLTLQSAVIRIPRLFI